MSSTLVLTTINAPYSKQLDAQGLALCLLHPEAAKAAPGHMSSFFGEVSPKLQIEFACSCNITEQQLAAAAKAFAIYSGESYPLAAWTHPDIRRIGRLLRIACALIRQVNAEQTIIDYWTFGGGTAMMLQIDHRESHDIDIFLHDPQFLAYLDPQKRDFKFEVGPTEYDGDGTKFLKLAFEDIGQIDFIVGSSMTPSPTTRRIIEDETVDLENVPEIITKKIYHRGSDIRPRDIFDIAAAAETHADAILEALRSRRDEVAKTLLTLDRLNPDFVNAAIADMAIKGPYKSIAKTAIERAKTILSAV